MSEFFGARTATLKDMLRVHMLYWRKFHEDDCTWDSRRNVVEKSEAEEIEDVRESAEDVQVVTKGNGSFRSRYHLECPGRRWLICEMDTEMGGTWKSLRIPPRDIQLAGHRGQSLELAAAGRLKGSAESELLQSVELFMNRLFQERTASYKAEAEIYGRHLKSFYSAKYDWQRHVASSSSSEAERIESITMVEGAHVITRGFHRHRNRYRLHLVGGQWSIQQVDLECPICAQRGQNSNCIWCKGTIWNRVRSSI